MSNHINIKSLKILLWNSNGLKQNEPELLDVLIDKKIDIALITETHYTTKTKNFFPDYSVYRTDHPDGTAHAGSAIIISSKIKHNLLPNLQLPTIQATNISIILDHIPTTISAVYCPPRPAITHRQTVLFLQSLGHSFIAGGDFNAKHPNWGCRCENPRGRMLLNVIQNIRCKCITPPGPTYWPSHQNRYPDILDFFLSSIPSHINFNIYNSNDITSDHNPVILDINGQPTFNSPQPSLSIGPVNWSKFSSHLENNTNLNISLKTSDEIENAAQDFVTAIQTAVFNSSYSPTNINSSKKNAYELPPDIKTLIAEKRRARSRWQRSGLPSDKRTLNYMSSTIKKLIQTHKSIFFKSKYQTLNTQDGSLWKATKNLLKIKNHPYPLKKEDGSLAISDEEKANVFGTHLSNIFTPHSNISPDPNKLNEIEKFLDSPLPMSLPVKHTSPREIKQFILKLKDKKSPGYDLITNKMLKFLPEKSIMLLTHLYNSMLRLSYFPLIWKFSTIILIHKPNKPKNEASSYRPISLLPVLAKLFEKILLHRIRSFTQTQKIVPDTQFGFRSKHSTIQQIHRIIDKISSSFEEKKYCPGVFLDVSQAFDRVWHQGLLFKIKKILPAPLYLIIKSYLSNRSFVVRQGNAFSSYFKIHAGVPQGSDLSPDLYNIFTADIPNADNILIATYADDTAILSDHNNNNVAASNLQSHLIKIEKWATNWKIKINVEKSYHIPFTLRKEISPVLHFEGKAIPMETHIKYLGLILDKRLTWGPHLKATRKKLNSRLHLLRPILKSNLSLNNKIIIYKSMLRPIWAYGVQIWGCAKPSQIKTIQAFQSITLRLLTSAPWYVTNNCLHKDLKIDSVTAVASNHYKKFHSKLATHTNPLIANQGRVNPLHNPTRRLKRRWCRDLLNL